MLPFEDVLGHVEGADVAMIRKLYGKWLLIGEDGTVLISKPAQAWLNGCMQAVTARRELLPASKVPSLHAF